MEQIKKVPVLQRTPGPNVFLISMSLDKSLTTEIDKKFELYTTKHLDLIPWSSDSLPFTGSEFEKVFILCGKDADSESRESLSVFYSALSRATKSALVLCLYVT